MTKYIALKVTMKFVFALTYFMISKVMVGFIVSSTLFMTQKGHRVIRRRRDLLYDPKGHVDFFG